MGEGHIRFGEIWSPAGHMGRGTYVLEKFGPARGTWGGAHTFWRKLVPRGAHGGGAHTFWRNLVPRGAHGEGHIRFGEIWSRAGHMGRGTYVLEKFGPPRGTWGGAHTFWRNLVPRGTKFLQNVCAP